MLVCAALNERRSVMATIAGRSVERGWGYLSCEGRISTNFTRERHQQCAGLCRSEREAILYGDHSWAYCGTNVELFIVRREDIDQLQTEVREAGIGPENSNEDVTPTMTGTLCRMLRESEERSRTTSLRFLPTTTNARL